MKTILYSFFLSCLFFSGLSYGQPTLKVGVAGSAPFVMYEQDTSGVALAVWEEVTDQLDWSLEYAYFDDVPQGLEALKEGEIGVLVGPTTITAERAESVQFSQPYFQSSLSILSKTEELGIWGRIKPFFSFRLLYAVLVFSLILACVGAVIWLAERKKSPEQFPLDPLRGIGNGMWCAIVTMTTTGYGDLAPVTLLGRIITAAWMIISIVFATSMVAGISSTLTLTGIGGKQIQTAEDLSRRRVAVVEDSPSSELVLEHNGKVVPIHNVAEGYEMLADNKVDAVVFDRPQLLHYHREHPDAIGTVSTAEYVKQGYGFALPLNSPITHDINVSLLQLQEEGTVNRIVARWIDDQQL